MFQLTRRVARSLCDNRRVVVAVQMFNFLVLGVDSVSRLNFARHMPRTRRFLLQELGAVELTGFNKVCMSLQSLSTPLTHTHTHTHPLNGPLSRTTRVSQYQKGRTNMILLKQETVSN